MTEPKVVHNTFVVERKFPQPVSVVFDAFSDPAKAKRWHSGDNSSDVVEFAMDFREGGMERMVYKMGPQTPFPGVPLENEGAIPGDCAERADRDGFDNEDRRPANFNHTGDIRASAHGRRDGFDPHASGRFPARLRWSQDARGRMEFPARPD